MIVGTFILGNKVFVNNFKNVENIQLRAFNIKYYSLQ